MRGLSQAALVFGSVLSLALMGTVPSAQAQRYPSKAIEIVVSYGAGGSTDLIARAIAQKLQDRLGQSVVVLSWTVLLGPKSMPGHVVELLQRETALALANSQVRASLAGQGVEPSQTQDVRAFLARERAKFGRVVRELAIAMD